MLTNAKTVAITNKDVPYLLFLLNMIIGIAKTGKYTRLDCLVKPSEIILDRKKTEPITAKAIKRMPSVTTRLFLSDTNL